MLSKIKTPTCFVSGIEGRNSASYDDSDVLQVQVVSCCYQFRSDLRAQHKHGLCVKSSHTPLIGRFTLGPQFLGDRLLVQTSHGSQTPITESGGLRFTRDELQLGSNCDRQNEQLA